MIASQRRVSCAHCWSAHTHTPYESNMNHTHQVANSGEKDINKRLHLIKAQLTHSRSGRSSIWWSQHAYGIVIDIASYELNHWWRSIGFFQPNAMQCAAMHSTNPVGNQYLDYIVFCKIAFMLWYLKALKFEKCSWTTRCKNILNTLKISQIELELQLCIWKMRC